MTFEAKFENGDFVWQNPNGLTQHLSALARKWQGITGKENASVKLWVSIEDEHPGPSLEQFRFFHGVVCKAISESTGDEVYEVRDALKRLFLHEVPPDEHGSTLPSLTTLSKREMNDLIDGSIRWAAEAPRCIVIEDPNRSDRMAAA